MTAPEPKPTLLSTMGVSGAVSSLPQPNTGSPQGRAPSRRAPRRPGTSRPSPAASDADRPDQGAETLRDALSRIQQRHRERRTAGVRTPLAPLNVDIPLDLLEHARRVSQDIPYPLRRLAEEAVELWLEATGYSPLGNSDSYETRPAVSGNADEEPKA